MSAATSTLMPRSLLGTRIQPGISHPSSPERSGEVSKQCLAHAEILLALHKNVTCGSAVPTWPGLESWRQISAAEGLAQASSHGPSRR